jgi:hypothetical protein
VGRPSSDYVTVLAHTPPSAAPWFRGQALPALWEAALGNGIDPLVMCAQTALETAWGRFGGVIDASFHNTAGIKTAAGGGDKDPGAHARFADLRTGAQAHACHLLSYATVGPLPAWNPDPRSHLVERGSAATVQELGAWAPSNPGYGADIAAIVHRLRGDG